MSNRYDCVSDFIFVERPTNCADVILIPGGSHKQLMEKAVELYLQGVSPYILPSGGYNKKILNFSTEFDFLKDIAINLGVPDYAILKEDMAKNTFENAEFSYKVLLQNAIAFSRVLIVCKAFHARRALLTYQYVFPENIEFYICPIVDTRGISKDTWQNNQDYINIVMAEVVKIGSYFKDKILHENQTGQR